MTSIIKIILAVLLLLCLADMPYGYYQFVRFVSMAAFVYLAYTANEEGKQTEAIIFGVLALLFQPFFKISLGRELWNIVDVITAIGLVGSIYSKQNPSKN